MRVPCYFCKHIFEVIRNGLTVCPWCGKEQGVEFQDAETPRKNELELLARKLVGNLTKGQHSLLELLICMDKPFDRVAIKKVLKEGYKE